MLIKTKRDLMVKTSTETLIITKGTEFATKDPYVDMFGSIYEVELGEHLIYLNHSAVEVVTKES